jgi:hypothetical protein
VPFKHRRVEAVSLDDLISTESAVVAAATAAVCSPRARETLRRGVVFGVAGAMKLGDVVTGAAGGRCAGCAVRNRSRLGAMTAIGRRSLQQSAVAALRAPAAPRTRAENGSGASDSGRGSKGAEERAEELVARCTSEGSRLLSRLLGRVREEAEDILAEARELHERSKRSEPEP